MSDHAAQLLRVNDSGPGGGSAADPRREPDPADADTRPDQRSIRAGSTGRVRHEEKITVYISSEELLRLEQARLALRSEFGISVDRGRVVREAIAAALDEIDTVGEDSELVRRLRASE